MRKQNPRAADLLSLMAMLGRQSIPRVFLVEKGEGEAIVIKSLGILQAFSLIEAASDGKAFSMHRLATCDEKMVECKPKITNLAIQSVKNYS